MDGFCRRKPAVKTLRGKGIESVRFEGDTTKIIQEFFDKLELPAIETSSPENRYNMDEAGILEGLGVNGLVVGSSALRAAYTKDSTRGHWTTFIECISATGQALNPLVIFRGKTIQAQWFPS